MPCDYPLSLKVKGQDVLVPCGKCAPCRTRRVNEWVFRLCKEEEVSISSHFVTLTYDTAHVPLTGNGFMTLRKKDVQDYMKRLRKFCKGHTLKYYAVGEYGTNNKRPHYHLIVFNCPDTDMFANAWSLGGVPLGGLYVGTCTNDSIAYCLKYIDKDTWRQKQFRHDRDDRQREFSVCSQGLGKNYLSESVVRFHKSDLSKNYVMRNNYRIPMPRYYRTKILNESEMSMQRDIINQSLSEKEHFDMLIHHHPQFSYIEKKEKEKEGRQQKFFNKPNRRKL